MKKRFTSLVIFCMVLCLVTVPSAFAKEKESNSAKLKTFLIINKANNELAYFKNGELIQIFDVGTGKSRSLTPEGTFQIINKVKNRPYYKEKIPGGSPKNPLGDRWMGLNVPGTWGNTYGIHGNNNERSIGKYVSAGCIRMHNEDVRWLFEQIYEGTDVLITHSKDKDFIAIAIENGFSIKEPTFHKVDKKLTVFVEKTLYKKPLAYKGYETGKITPQVVTAFEETDDQAWYRIYTWFGDAWISSASLFEGELIKQETKINLKLVTPLYASPTTTAASIGAVSPQTVTSFEQIGNWHHIHTWFGDAWIHVNK